MGFCIWLFDFTPSVGYRIYLEISVALVAMPTLVLFTTNKSVIGEMTITHQSHPLHPQ
jgi:hypothetical protein